MFPMMPSFKIALMVLLHRSGGPIELQIRNLKKKKKTSAPEPLTQIQNNVTELFLIIPSTKIANGYTPLNKRAAIYPDKIYL